MGTLAGPKSSSTLPTFVPTHVVYPRFVPGLYQTAADGEKRKIAPMSWNYWVFWTSSNTVGRPGSGEGGIRIPQFCSGISRFSAVYPRPYPRADVGLRTDRHRMTSDSVG